MKKWAIVVLVILSLTAGYWLFMFLNKPRIRPIAPVRSTLDSTLTLPVSTIRIPIEFQLKDLEKMVNTRLKGIFIQEWIPVGDKERDSVYLELERTNQIRFTWKPGTLFASVPLRISFRFVARKAGIRIQNDKPIVAEVILNLKSKINLDDEWRVKSTTELDSVIWEMEPSIKIAFFNFNLRQFADTYLEKNQTKLTLRFDSLTHELLDTRKIVEKIWGDIQKPIVIKKTEPKIGLQAHAQDLTSRWNKDPDGDISAMITLKAQVYSWFESPPPQAKPPLPKHNYATKEDEELDLYVLAKIPFDQINRFANENLHKLSYSYGSYTVAIRNAELYGSGQELALQMSVKGTVRGKVYLRALPYYDTLNQVIGLSNLRYDLHTEEVLLSSADWMLKDKLLLMIADTVKKDLSEELSGLPQLIEQAIERGKSGNKMTLTVDSLRITSHASLITGKDIQWILRARGTAGIALDKKIMQRKGQKK